MVVTSAWNAFLSPNEFLYAKTLPTFNSIFIKPSKAWKLSQMTPSFPQTLTALNLFLKMILVCLKTHSWILLFSRVWLVLTQFRKIESTISVCPARQGQAIGISEQVNTLQIQTPNSVGATQHAQGHTAVRRGPHFQVPWLLLHGSCLTPAASS